MEATEALALSLSIVFKQFLGLHETCKVNRVIMLLSFAGDIKVYNSKLKP